MSRRIRITLAYDGTEFHGWQCQPGLPTIQGVLEEIIGGIEGSRVHVAGSGRTDAGVHARGQVAAFTIANPIPADNLQRAVNRLLPPAIRVTSVAETHAGFHPRFDSLAKTYRYTIFREPLCPPFLWRYVHHHPYPLNEAAMMEAAAIYAGRHDFTAFAAADDRELQSRVRTVFSSGLERAAGANGASLVYTVRGSGFLKHMVRNLVGTLLELGRGNLDQADLRRLITPPVSRGCCPTAPAKGLCLESVEYPG